MAEYVLSALLKATDKGFQSVIKKAQEATQKLESTVGKIKQDSILNIRANVQGLQNVQRLQSATDAARNSANKPLSVQLRDAASQQLNKIRTELNSLTGKAHQIIANVKINGGEKLSQMKQSLSSGVSGAMLGAGATFAGLGAAGGLAFGVTNAFQSQMQFEKEMSSVKAILSGSYSNSDLEKVMASLTSKAEEMGMATQFTAAESARALYYMGMAGWKSEQMLEGLPAVLNLASAGNTDLSTTSDILTDSLTAFGLKAGEYAKVNGKTYESSKYYADLMAATVTNANTDIVQLGEALKYAAPLVQSMYANAGVNEKMTGAQDLMLVNALMANAGIKGSQAGTSARAMFTRLSSQNRNAYFGQNALGVDFLDDSGEVRRLKDIVTDFRKVFQQGADMSKVADFFEQISGEKIHADTRRKLDSYFESAQKNGGKLSGSEMMKMVAMMAGQEAMSGWLATFLASEEDFEKISAALDNASGSAEKMSKIQMDNLAGSFTYLGSAWDAFQRSFVSGGAGEGLKKFVDSVTQSLQMANELFKDGIDFSDLVKLGSDAVTKLKDKFLELDGIGSILAGGALFYSLKKILSLAANVKNTVADLFKTKTNADISQKVKSENTATLNVTANVVNVNGRISGTRADKLSSQNQAKVDSYYNRRQQILNQGTNATTATTATTATASTALKSGLKIAGGAAALSAIFGVMDVISAKNNSEYTNSLANDELKAAKQELITLREEGADVNQIQAQVSRIASAEKNVRETAELNRINELQTNGGAVGTIAGAATGAALGSVVPVVGTMIGGLIGAVLGQYGGENAAVYLDSLNKNKKGGNVDVETALITASQNSSRRREADIIEREKISNEKTQMQTASVAGLRQVDEHNTQAQRLAQIQSENLKTKINETQNKIATSTANSLNYDATKTAVIQTPFKVPKIESPKIEMPEIDAGKFQAAITSYQGINQGSVMTNYSQSQISESPKIDAQKFQAAITSYQTPKNNFAMPPVQIPKIEMPEINIAEKISSSFESAKASVINFGNDISATFSSSFESAKSYIENFGNDIFSVFESVQTSFSDFGSNFSVAFESIKSYINNFGNDISSNFEVIKSNIFNFGNEITSSFISSFESLSNSASLTFSNLNTNIQAGVETARAVITMTFQNAADIVQSIWSAMPGFFGGIFGSLGSIASAAGSAIASGINSGIGMIQSAWEGLSGWLSAKISSIASAAANAAASIGINIGANAKGTASWQGGFTQINEHGGELIELPGGQSIYPFNTTKNILQSSDIAHNAKGTSFFEGGWSEINEHGGELIFLPKGARIYPHATTVKILREQIREKLKNATSQNTLSKNINSDKGKIESYQGFYQFGNVDELGNLRGADIAEYNRLMVRQAKINAQKEFLLSANRNDLQRNDIASRMFEGINKNNSARLDEERKIRGVIGGGAFDYRGSGIYQRGGKTDIFNDVNFDPFDIGNLPTPTAPQFNPQISSGDNSKTTSNSNSSAIFNFGGVNISNGLDFDEFTQKLMKLFTQGAANSVNL